MRARFASSNPTPSGYAQGTMGGQSAAAGPRPGSRQMYLGDEVYLWFLVFSEVGIMCLLRNKFRRHHGG